MKIKWICKYCGNPNICEDTGPLICDACDSLRSDEPLISMEGGAIRPAGGGESPSGGTPAERRDEKPRFRVASGWNGREAYLVAEPLNEAAKRAARPETARIAPLPVPELPKKASGPRAIPTAEKPAKEPAKRKPVKREAPVKKKEPVPAKPAPAADFLSEGPWPEHRAVVTPENREAMKKQGILAVSRSVQNGVKGYTVVKADGEHFMTAGKMKMMGLMSQA